MTEFTKTKTHFALALIGTLFALHPLVEKYPDAGFKYFDYDLKAIYAYGLLAGLLACSAYCYAVGMVSERPSSLLERLGNSFYGIAIMTPPLYGMLYLASFLAERLGQEHLAWAAPALAVGLVIGWLLIGQLLAWRLRKQDNTAKVNELAEQEIAALTRARELFEHEHYDLSVIEAWKAVEARVRRVLLKRGVVREFSKPMDVIDAAIHHRLVREPAIGLLHELQQQWSVAVGVTPLTKDAADAALSAARHILATIAIDTPGKASK